MEIDETAILDDRGFIQLEGDETKDFLQNIVTNDLEKVDNKHTLFTSLLTPQGKYLYEFFIIKSDNKYLLECEKQAIPEILKIFNFYKLRSKVSLIDVSKKYINHTISLEKFEEISKKQISKGFTTTYKNSLIYVDPRNKNLGGKIVSKIENIESIIKDLNLKKIDKKKYYTKSFELGIPQINLSKLKDKIFGIENNLDELGGIDFKKGCYIGQENTSRIKLRNKLRKRILPIKKISGDFLENDIIKYKDNEVGKVMIDQPYPFALIKIIDPDLEELRNIELTCGKSKIKIIKPDWL